MGGLTRRCRQPQTLDPILTMMTSRPTDRRNVLWFIAWMLTGAGYALGILGALSIGPYVLVITVAATFVLATRPGSTVGLPGLISGISLPMFYVAFLNRSGPAPRPVRANPAWMIVVDATIDYPADPLQRGPSAWGLLAGVRSMGSRPSGIA